ncbi:hypothetical protein CRUP_025431 [Coryphaenoides rupestris]|nr:hypothetical protein CRUP_025431 [Coryphaenoides rupestris]
MSCPVCLDLYTDPLVLGCSHSFCRSCVETIWKDQRKGQPRECPVYRSPASDTPTTNLVLQKIVETRRKQEGRGGGGGGGGGEEEQEDNCEDQELLCLVCQTSRNHKDHQLCPLEEAALDCKVMTGDKGCAPLELCRRRGWTYCFTNLCNA